MARLALGGRDGRESFARMGGRRKEAQAFIAQNRSATFHYVVSERYEAGIVLRGSEVKSLREGRVQLADAYASVENGEVWLRQLHIASFFAARAFPHAERGARKLLLHAKEIRDLARAVLHEGYTLVPLDLHFKNGRVKVTLGVARGKREYDKRAAIRARTEARDARQEQRKRTQANTARPARRASSVRKGESSHEP